LNAVASERAHVPVLVDSASSYKPIARRAALTVTRCSPAAIEMCAKVPSNVALSCHLTVHRGFFVQRLQRASGHAHSL